MQLGFHELDEEQQKKAQKNVDFHRKSRTVEIYILYVFLGAWLVYTGYLGIRSISDRSYLSSFLQSLTAIAVICAIIFGFCMAWKYFLNWVFERQNNEKLPKKSDRSLKNVLNHMSGNIALLIWELLFGIYGFSGALVIGIMQLFSVRDMVKYGSISLVVFSIGYVLFQWIHKRRDLTKCLLRNTVEYYNYGDGQQYAEYVDRSIRENLLLCCKQYALTNEFFLGYAHSDIGFYPVAIPRDFVKEAEVRVVLSADSQVSVNRAVLACKLHNGKVIHFYLSRYQGNRLAMELLYKNGFFFTVRTDVIEYQ